MLKLYKHYMPNHMSGQLLHMLTRSDYVQQHWNNLSTVSQMKHQLDATLCRFYFCRVTLHVSGASAHHQEYLNWMHSVPALIRRCDNLPAMITHVPVAAVLVLNTPDDGRLRPKHVQWLCRNKTCKVLHQVGVSFDLYCDARKHKIKIYQLCFVSC